MSFDFARILGVAVAVIGSLWRAQSAFPRKIYIALKYNSLLLKFPSESRLSQNPSSKRMQIFSNA